MGPTGAAERACGVCGAEVPAHRAACDSCGTLYRSPVPPPQPPGAHGPGQYPPGPHAPGPYPPGPYATGPPQTWMPPPRAGGNPSMRPGYPRVEGFIPRPPAPRRETPVNAIIIAIVVALVVLLPGTLVFLRWFFAT
jgi:hypothetical protein